MSGAVLVRSREIVTCDTNAAQCGVAFGDLGCIPGGALIVESGRITALGRENEVVRAAPKGVEEVDLRDCAIVPGFVDAHAHPLFAGDREPDFASRTHGEKPEQGMLQTVRQTREALHDAEAFYGAVVRPRLRLMLEHGTTTLETKTGYALTKNGELALLDLVAAHRDDDDVPRLVSTFLGAHAVPPEFDSSGVYVDYLVSECVPEVPEHGADYADVFCEPGYFSVEDARRYLQAAKDRGLRLRIHCDEMSGGGAVQMAVEMGVDAVDHCNYIDDGGVAAVIDSGTVLVACPATIAFLGIERHAPVRAVLERGGSVALASDFNPGTSPCFNLQTVAYYGRKLFGMSAAEALYGVTRAAALTTRPSLRGGTGELHLGGDADFVALRIDDAREFGWQFGGNLAKLVVKGGVLVTSIE